MEPIINLNAVYYTFMPIYDDTKLFGYAKETLKENGFYEGNHLMYHGNDIKVITDPYMIYKDDGKAIVRIEFDFYTPYVPSIFLDFDMVGVIIGEEAIFKDFGRYEKYPLCINSDNK